MRFSKSGSELNRRNAGYVRVAERYLERVFRPRSTQRRNSDTIRLRWPGLLTSPLRGAEGRGTDRDNLSGSALKRGC